MIKDEVELNTLLNSIRSIYGYDFTDYAVASVKRRVSHFMNLYGITTVKELMDLLFSKESMFEHFVQEFTVNVTEMFRDPEFYLALRQQVVKRLATYPYIRIWIAGCSTGEEVYSIAILLEEEGLLHKSVIYATDIHQKALSRAKESVFSLHKMKTYTSNYIRAAGKKSFSDYYTAKYDGALFDKRLSQHVVFSVHNLAVDSSFNEFQLISCRNVLIYFNQPLQNKTINLFYESLCPFGILCLGNKESLLFSDKKASFAALDKKQKIFIKTS